jgi:hypothetical protein
LGVCCSYGVTREGTMNKDCLYAHCLVSRLDSVLCNAERIRAMLPVFALRIDNLAVSVTGASVALQGLVEGAAR